MKKTLLTSVLVLAGMLAAQAQDHMYQPKEITARRINSSGQVTREFPASFSYDSEGKLTYFSFPEWDMHTIYSYENNKLTYVTTSHTGGGLLYSDEYLFTYEEDLLKTEKHLWGQMNSDECYDYYYNEEGRLVRKELGDGVTGYFACWLYEYDDQLRTMISSLYGYYSVQGFWYWGVHQISMYQYDEEYNLLSVQTDNLNPETQVVTRSVRTLYSYNPSGRLESVTEQTLTDGQWTNNTVEMRLYGNDGRVSQQQYGQWSDELGDWRIHRKITHEFDEDDLTYTISFFKKEGDAWVRDAFSYQTLLFEPQLKWQQKALEQMIWDDLQESTMINQIEMTMVSTPRPTYMAVDEQNADCVAFPNPGDSEVTVSVPAENAVVRFYDIHGRLVLARPFAFKTRINTADWAKGIYLWEVWNGAIKEASGKWVKE